jgi:16S rRNA (guanine966-N2)-methyltransferase
VVKQKVPTKQKKKMPRKKHLQKSKQSNTLRIIGGQWRSRKLQIINAEGMRPTPDRVRETLFNWLQNDIHDARCLDLFAGSGALGLEALSRGAKEVVFIEKNKAVAEQLRQNLKVLKSEMSVTHMEALDYLNTQNKTAFDIIFLDPPYRKDLLLQSLNKLIEQRLIQPQTLIYLEHESEESFDWGDWGMTSFKEIQAGQVKSYLLHL